MFRCSRITWWQLGVCFGCTFSSCRGKATDATVAASLMQNMQRYAERSKNIWYDVVNVNKMFPKNPDMTHDTWPACAGFSPPKKRKGP